MPSRSTTLTFITGLAVALCLLLRATLPSNTTAPRALRINVANSALDAEPDSVASASRSHWRRAFSDGGADDELATRRGAPVYQQRDELVVGPRDNPFSHAAARKRTRREGRASLTQRLRADMGYEGSVPASVGGLQGLPIGEPPEPALNWKRDIAEDEGDCDDGDDCDDEDSYSYSMEDEDGE